MIFQKNFLTVKKPPLYMGGFLYHLDSIIFYFGGVTSMQLYTR